MRENKPLSIEEIIYLCLAIGTVLGFIIVPFVIGFARLGALT